MWIDLDEEKMSHIQRWSQRAAVNLSVMATFGFCNNFMRS